MNKLESMAGCADAGRMDLAPEPYLPRRIAHLEHWRGAGHEIKIYGIHRDVTSTAPMLADDTLAAVRTATRDVLEACARDTRSHGLGFCIVHVGEEAVWLLVDWWTSGGILCQRMLSAPLAQPGVFKPVSAPALACVWELVVTAHERNAWVRHMLTTIPNPSAYGDDVLPAGSY